MAVVHAGTDSKAETSTIGTTLSWSHTVDSGTNRFLVVGIAATSQTSPNTVTYGGVSMTLIGEGAAANRMAQLYGLVAPAVGEATVSVTLFSDSRTIQGFGVGYEGVDPSSSYGSAAGATGNDAAPTVNVSSATDQLVVGVVAMQRDDLVEGLTVGANQTSRAEDVSSDGVVWLQAGFSDEAGAATTTFSYSSNVSNIWGIVAAPLKPLAAATASLIVPMRMI